MEFTPFPKIPRFNRTVFVTEKIDGTNAQVCITQEPYDPADETVIASWTDGSGADAATYTLRAGSRKRWVTPEADNFGFAKWVATNVDRLKNLGEGTHFGEWWGAGIQRRYGLDEKRFSLFNANRWKGAADSPEFTEHTGCHVVPTLMIREMQDLPLVAVLEDLCRNGSKAAPGFMQPEGIVIFHSASGTTYKITLDNDQLPKGLAHGQ